MVSEEWEISIEETLSFHIKIVHTSVKCLFKLISLHHLWSIFGPASKEAGPQGILYSKQSYFLFLPFIAVWTPGSLPVRESRRNQVEKEAALECIFLFWSLVCNVQCFEITVVQQRNLSYAQYLMTLCLNWIPLRANIGWAVHAPFPCPRDNRFCDCHLSPKGIILSDENRW